MNPLESTTGGDAQERSAPQTMFREGAIQTKVSPAVAWFMIGTFFLLIAGVPLLQGLRELAEDRRLQLLDLLERTPDKANLRAWEDHLEKVSTAKSVLQPWLQELLCGLGHFGNSNAVVGRDGWLFYRPGVDYLGGPGILDATRFAQRRRQFLVEGDPQAQPDPRPAILSLHRQCQARGIHLVVLPIPDKAMLQPGRLSGRLAFSGPMPPPNNVDFRTLVDELRAEGVDLFDCSPATITPDDRRFLIQDTHWTPEWMQSVAAQLAAHLQDKLGPAAPPRIAYRLETSEVRRAGDLVDMLRLSDDQQIFQPQTVHIQRVVDAGSGQPWQPSGGADVLVLGDSFSNIYSLQSMGWGDAAGFVEHLSVRLKRPMDRIARNDAGAFASRQILADQLARGKERLAGKKVVVWEFAMRELTAGNWKVLEMKQGIPLPRHFLTPGPGQERVVTGIVEAAAPAPRPGTVPYRDHIVAVHLTDLEDASGPIEGGEALVYLWSMRGNVLTSAARYRPEQKVTLRLRPWSDVADKLEAINRRELDNDEINLQEPCWGEEVRP